MEIQYIPPKITTYTEEELIDFTAWTSTGSFVNIETEPFLNPVITINK